MSVSRAHIVSSAEELFDQHGFTATGMDTVTKASGVSTRTLYKHVGSKSALVAAVLNDRSERFFQSFQVRSVEALFDGLERWIRDEGARGCLFFRALSEARSDDAVSAAVAVYRRRLCELVSSIASSEVGPEAADDFGEQLLVLFEGATVAASYRGAQAVLVARTAASVLIDYYR